MADKIKIFLTGGSGFLGSNLLRKLIALDYSVFVLLRARSSLSRIDDLRGRFTPVSPDASDLGNLFSSEKFSSIIHCATNYGREKQVPLDILEANLTLPLKLLQIGSESGVKCFVNTDTVLDKRVNNYALSKRHLRDWLQSYSDRMTCVNVALEHFYGPGDNPSKFVTWIVHSLIKDVPTIKLTKGEQKRDFIYIDDVAEAFTYILRDSLKREKGFFHYEIGSGQLVSISDFVMAIKRLVGNTSTFLDFGAIPYRENEVMASSVDLSGIQKLGWSPVVSLENGLNRTIEIEKKEFK